jgi:hypothetical protein
VEDLFEGGAAGADGGFDLRADTLGFEDFFEISH